MLLDLRSLVEEEEASAPPSTGGGRRAETFRLAPLPRLIFRTEEPEELVAIAAALGLDISVFSALIAGAEDGDRYAA